MKYKQRGYNCLWPLEIETWRLGEKVPEWLSDIALVEFIDGEGNITLRMRNTSGGGYEILQAGVDKAVTLISMKKKEDYVCIPVKSDRLKDFPPEFEQYSSPFFLRSISPQQLKLIYE